MPPMVEERFYPAYRHHLARIAEACEVAAIGKRTDAVQAVEGVSEDKTVQVLEYRVTHEFSPYRKTQ